MGDERKLEGGPLRCSKRKRTFCRRLDQMLAPEANVKQKGLSVMVVTKWQTSESRAVGVVYRTGAKDRGLMVNFCPWCGASLAWWPKQPAAKPKAAPEWVPT